jgi:hypothetical protein
MITFVSAPEKPQANYNKLTKFQFFSVLPLICYNKDCHTLSCDLTMAQTPVTWQMHVESI